MAKIRIGVSGWSYSGWRGSFYPDDLPRRRELSYTSERFGSVEINGSFYSLQKPESYRSWYADTPRGFVFSVKGSRFITHNKKLRDIEVPLANFLASGVLALKEKLGPILWQLPEILRFDAKRISEFLALLPHDTRSAAHLARRHDERVEGRSWTRIERNRRLRHALEIRHESFLVPEFVRIARDTGTAVVFADSGKWPYTEELTAGFVYVRLHGSPDTYASRYSDTQLDRWAERILSWRRGEEPERPRRITNREPPPRKGRDVYVYFDNDQHAHAPRDASRLAQRLEVDR